MLSVVLAIALSAFLTLGMFTFFRRHWWEGFTYGQNYRAGYRDRGYKRFFKCREDLSMFKRGKKFGKRIPVIIKRGQVSSRYM